MSRSGATVAVVASIPLLLLGVIFLIAAMSYPSRIFMAGALLLSGGVLLAWGARTIRKSVEAGSVIDSRPTGEALSAPTRPFAVQTTPHEQHRPQRGGLRVFLCHSSRDKEAVEHLYQRLVEDGFGPWLDKETLLPGQDWRLEIEKAVRSSDVVIVCLSQRSVTQAGYVHKETRYALDVAEEQPEGRIFIIPARLDDCEVPFRLRRWQWVDLFEKDGYEQLVRALRHRAGSFGQ